MESKIIEIEPCDTERTSIEDTQSELMSVSDQSSQRSKVDVKPIMEDIGASLMREYRNRIEIEKKKAEALVHFSLLVVNKLKEHIADEIQVALD